MIESQSGEMPFMLESRCCAQVGYYKAVRILVYKGFQLFKAIKALQRVSIQIIDE